MSSALAKAAAAKAAAEGQAAMAAAAGKAAAKKEKEKQQLVPREMPSRHARAAAAEQIRKTGTASAKQKEPLAGTAAAAAHLEGDEDEKGEAGPCHLQHQNQPSGASRPPPLYHLAVCLQPASALP